MKITSHAMMRKIVILTIGLVFVAGCIRQSRDHTSNLPIQENDSDNNRPAIDRTVIAYYFHGTIRCSTCLKIEQLARDVVISRFPDELSHGILQLKIINSDMPENRHFEDLFQLKSQAVILAIYDKGALERWKNLPGIWDYYDKEEVFFDYIHEEIMLILSEL